MLVCRHKRDSMCVSPQVPNPNMRDQSTWNEANRTRFTSCGLSAIAISFDLNASFQNANTFDVVLLTILKTKLRLLLCTRGFVFVFTIHSINNVTSLHILTGMKWSKVSNFVSLVWVFVGAEIQNSALDRGHFIGFWPKSQCIVSSRKKQST